MKSVSKPFLRLRNVAGDLGFQFFERTKFLLVAQLFADFDFQFPAVKVAAKIKQMRLDAKLRPAGRQRRTDADVKRDRLRFFFDFGKTEVNAVGWQNQARRVEIRGWEKSIIQKSPNLKRWHWMPITAAYNHNKPIMPSKKPWKVYRMLRKAPVDMQANNPRYMRPMHASMPSARNSDGSTRHNPRVSNPLVTHDVDGQLRARDVQAKLQMQRTQAQLATNNVDAGLSLPVVRGNYQLAKHEVAGYLSNKKTDIKLNSHDVNAQKAVAGQLACKNVDGRLISENVDGALSSKSVSADLMTPITRRYDFTYRGPNEGFDDTPTFKSGYQSVKSRVSAKLSSPKSSRSSKY